MTISAIPEVAIGVPRNISDAKLLRYAAMVALHHVPRESLHPLFADVLAQHDTAIETELAALLASFYVLDEESSEHDVLLHRIMQDYKCPLWVDSCSFKSYASTIIAEAIARHLLNAGGWERPSHLTPSRRGATSVARAART